MNLEKLTVKDRLQIFLILYPKAKEKHPKGLIPCEKCKGSWINGITVQSGIVSLWYGRKVHQDKKQIITHGCVNETVENIKKITGEINL